MDKLIELAVFYLADWQQTAIDNTRYSVVLIMVALFFGGILIALVKKKTIAGLQRQINQGKHKQKQLEQLQEQLLVAQKTDAEQIASLQNKSEQVSEQIETQKQEHLLQIQQKEEMLIKSSKQKQLEIDGLKESIKEKDQSLHLQQGTLDKQKSQISQYALDQEKIEELEQEVRRFTDEFDGVKRQLETSREELAGKEKQIERLNKVDQVAGEQINKIMALEQQLVDLRKIKTEERPSDEQIELKDLKIQLGLEKKNAENKEKHTIELENTIQQHNQQLTQFNEKLQRLVEPQAVKQETVPQQNHNAEKQGFIEKVMKLVYSLDKVDISDPKEEIQNELEIENIWEKHQRIIDLLLEQEAAQVDSHAVSELSSVSKVEEKPLPTIEVANTEADTEQSIDDKPTIKSKIKQLYNQYIP